MKAHTLYNLAQDLKTQSGTDWADRRLVPAGRYEAEVKRRHQTNAGHRKMGYQCMCRKADPGTKGKEGKD
eukprot:scaffold195532_cov20-Tisochrysis_lutea.AAC.1